MRSVFAIVAAIGSIVLCGCASSLKVVAETPASIELECVGAWGGCESPQKVADTAQRHCQKYGRNAAESSLSTSQSGNRWVTYRCI